MRDTNAPIEQEPDDESENETSDLDSNGLDLEALHKEALKQYSYATDYWDEIYTRSLNDVEFGDGNQWQQAQIKSRKKRPTITENKVPQFVDAIVSPVREEGLKIKLAPPDMSDLKDAAQQKVLKARVDVYQGKISDIEKQCNALEAYVKALQFSTTGGIGFIRITILPNEYTGIPEAKIVRKPYPWGSYLDPAIMECTGSDAEYGFEAEKLDRTEYEEKYGKASMLELPSSPSTSLQSWVSKDEITVCEYFKIIKTNQTILIMNDGTEVIMPQDISAEELASMPIKGTRKDVKRELFHAKMNGVKFLEHTLLPIPFIPLVLVSGREIIVNQKKSLVGVVHYMKDAQMKYNFYASAEVEIVALSPKATFMAAAQQIEPYKKIWNNITTVNIDVLPYDATPINGVAVPAPTRLSMLNNDFTALIAAKQAAFEDMKQNTGIYNVGLAEKTIDQSGKAILLREKSQSTNSNIYRSNLSESIKQVARILIEILPMTFDPSQPIQILTDDDKPQKVKVSENPFTLNCSDMIIDVGRNYDTRRAENTDQMMNLITLLTPIVPDQKKLSDIAAIFVKGLDNVNAQRISDILMGVGADGQPTKDAAELEADLQKAMQVIQTLQAHIADQDKKLADKQADRELDMDKAILDTKTKLAVKELDIQGNIEIAQGQIAQRAISHGGALIPDLVPKESDINLDVANSVNATTDGIVSSMDAQSDIGFGENQENSIPPTPIQPDVQPPVEPTA